MNEITIVKIGGKIINEDSLLRSFLKEFSAIPGMKILVHGGGRAATKMLNELGMKIKMIDGRRITDAATLDVCVGQYAGVVNKRIVGILQSMDVDAMGLSGADGQIILSNKRPASPIDYGYVGDITHIDSKKLIGLITLGFVPVFCAVTADTNGQLLNTNADTIASALASELANSMKVDLRYCFEFDGVLSDLVKMEVIDVIKGDQFQELIDHGVLQGGVIPKVHNAIVAKESGVSSVSICGISNLINLQNATKIKES